MSASVAEPVLPVDSAGQRKEEIHCKPPSDSPDVPP